MMSPLTTVTKIRHIFGRYPDNSGGCLKLFLLLRALFPHYKLKALYNSDHVIIQHTSYFDVDTLYEELPEGYFPLKDFGIINIVSAFKEFLTDEEVHILSDYFRE